MTTYREHMRRAAADYLVALLLAHRGNVMRAAKAAGVNRTALHKLMVKLGVTQRIPPRRSFAWRAAQ